MLATRETNQQQNPPHRRKKPLQLFLNVASINDEIEISKSPHWSNEETYRMDGISIGRDYLRVEGVTITRGQLLPSTIDVLEEVGKGAFSTVHRALWKKKIIQENNTHDENNMSNITYEYIDVAVKEYSLLESFRQRRRMLLQELRTLSKFDAPALLNVLGAFIHGHQVTLVLEYMKGGSLENLIQQQKLLALGDRSVDCKMHDPVLSESLIAPISYQMLCGLAYLHAQDRRVLHRDLKPANVLFDHTTGSVKLCDFGMSSLLDENSMNTTVMGTTKYMSPERLRAKAYGRASDIWSFGLIVLQCITGEPPWDGVDSLVDLLITIEEMDVNELIPSEFRVSIRLREIVVGSLQLEPRKRIPSHLLLHSPWYCNEHSIRSYEEAMALTSLNLPK